MRLGWNRRKQGACLGDDAILELRIAHERGALHGPAALVVIDAGLTGCLDQDLGDDARGSLRGAQYLDEGHEQRHKQRNDVFLQKTDRGADIAPAKAGGWIKARFDRAEAQPWSLTREHHHGGNIALF